MCLLSLSLHESSTVHAPQRTDAGGRTLSPAQGHRVVLPPVHSPLTPVCTYMLMVRQCCVLCVSVAEGFGGCREQGSFSVLFLEP